MAALEHDPAGALRALLAVWADYPVAELAEVIEREHARIDVAAIDGDSVAARDAAFAERAARRDPVDLPVLLAYALQDRASPRMPAAQVAMLVGFPPDPRTTAPALAALRGKRWKTSEVEPFWDNLFALIAAHADPRIRAPLGELELANRRYGRPTAMIDRRDALLATPAREVVAGVADAIRVAIAAAPPTAVDALIAAALADPAAPRDVLRDALLARGDRRGEHMALDALARTRPLTGDELVRQSVAGVAVVVESARRGRHQPGRARRLPRRVRARRRVHRRARRGRRRAGLANGRAHRLLRLARAAPREAVRERADALARDARLADRAACARAVWTPATTWLRGIHLFDDLADWHALFADGACVPALERVELVHAVLRPDALAPVAATPVFARLRELVVPVPGEWLAAWHVATDRLRQLERVHLDRHVFARDDRGALAHLTVTLPSAGMMATVQHAARLASLAPGTIRTVRFVGRAITRGERAKLLAGLAAQPIEHVDAYDKA